MTELNLRFLPWLRRGLARSIRAGDSFATMEFSLKVGGELVTQALRVRGPGDVVGIDPTQVLRTEPRGGTVDFEPNYFPYIEFVTPDLPWLFTPAAPDGDKLLPWLTLVTVDAALAALKTQTPLPMLTAPLSELPPDLNEMWAWAHVQTTTLYAANGLTQALQDAPETFISRVISPRNLKSKTAYLACLVPTYEAGRLAGLGLSGAEEAGDTLAWSADTPSSEIELPVYYSWSFQTGAKGDFEMLVERLHPQELDESVGRRALDLSQIGIPLSKEIPRTTTFYGALVSPTAIPEIPPKSLSVDPLRQTLYDFLTAPADPAPDVYDYRVDDPVVTPAVYGREQLSGEALPPPKPDTVRAGSQYEPVWYGDVNTHPRTRAAAGLGVRIVRQHQEDFMARAWSEVTSLRAINQTLQQATFASIVSNRWQGRVTQLESGGLLSVTRTAHSHVLPAGSSQTTWGQLRAAAVPDGSISTDLQRITRSGAVVQHLMRLARPSAAIQHEVRQVIVQSPTRLTALSIHTLPRGAATLNASEPDVYQEPVSDALGQSVNQLDAILAGGITTAERPSAAQTILTSHNLASGHIAYLGGMTRSGRSLTQAAEATLSTARQLTSLSNQYFSMLATGQTPGKAQVQSIRNQALALHDAFQQAGSLLTPVSTPTSEATLDSIAVSLAESLVPDATISAHLKARIHIADGAWGERAIPTRFTASPCFGEPVYPYVCELSPEFLLPGVGDLQPNTVGLVEVNGEYVEALLLGINHEMSREMLWREYPAQLTGTWFKHFWSAAQEDIKDIASWDRQTRLGENLTGFGGDDALVLLIKGDILRRYPNLGIYAVQATVITEDSRRIRVVKTPENQLFPAFSGELDTGVKFFGFDASLLSFPDVLGDATPTNDSTDGGWFFALQEQPTEPRFGLDEYKRGKRYNLENLTTWSELSWGHFRTEDVQPVYLSISGQLDDLTLPDTTDIDAPNSTWGSSAGAMARIVLQRPVRMLVHASAMLPEGV